MRQPLESRSRESILIVDDQPDLRMTMARLLEQAGYEVWHANGTQEAFALWQEKRYGIDLVITDISMPGGSGEMFAAQLRKIEPDLRIIFTSGYTKDFLGYEPAKTHSWFLAKPWSAEEMLQLVRRCLDQPRGSSSPAPGAL